MLALIDEGDVHPTVEDVADRAGVAPRTVFQHFATRETLFAAVNERHMERLAPLLADPDTADAPLARKLDAFVERRAELYEAMTPVRRAARHMAPLSKTCERAMHALQARKRDQAVRLFEPEIRAHPRAVRDELCAAVGAAASWSMWDALRSEQGISVRAASAAMRRTLDGLLARR